MLGFVGWWVFLLRVPPGPPDRSSTAPPIVRPLGNGVGSPSDGRFTGGWSVPNKLPVGWVFV